MHVTLVTKHWITLSFKGSVEMYHSGVDIFFLWTIIWVSVYMDKCVINPPKPGPQSRALCGAVYALSITIVLY